MPSQFPISSPCPFERNKGVGSNSFYYGGTQLTKNLRLKKTLNDVLKRFHEYL